MSTTWKYTFNSRQILFILFVTTLASLIYFFFFSWTVRLNYGNRGQPRISIPSTAVSPVQSQSSAMGLSNTSKFSTVKPADLTFQCALGELGNRMMYYAVVYGIAHLNQRKGFIQECNIKTCEFNNKPCDRNLLNDTFLLTLPIAADLPKGKQKGHKIHLHSNYPDDFRITNDVNILVGDVSPMSVTHFFHVREEVRQEFKFKEQFVSFSHNMLISARGHRKTATFVGVHVRRTSYLALLKRYDVSQAPQAFYNFGLRYFRNRFLDAVFVVISDDLEWCRKHITGFDVFIPDRESTPENDLAVLSHCNHSIFDYGTYGFWGAFLAGGDTLYYTDGIIDWQFKDPIKKKIMYPPEWTGISNVMLRAMEEK